MRVVFRVDASIQMGNGHVMRCLTMADALAACGTEILFICREHAGNLIDFIAARGYKVVRLTLSAASNPNLGIEYSAWLGDALLNDAADTVAQIRAQFGACDWLVVDHYALQFEWHRALRPFAAKIMVIDDLADRSHDCDLLLDQTLGRRAADYCRLTPVGCQLLCGAEYALLRPEFAQLRPQCQARRAIGPVNRLLVSMGGVDKDNHSLQILKVLQHTSLPDHCHVTVVLGATAPGVDVLRKEAERAPFSIDIQVDVKDMAQLMLNSDLAIGAAGSSAWERCCLGLPTIMVVVAENQLKIAESLAQQGAALVLPDQSSIVVDLAEKLEMLLGSSTLRQSMSRAALGVTRGEGTVKVLAEMGM